MVKHKLTFIFTCILFFFTVIGGFFLLSIFLRPSLISPKSSDQFDFTPKLKKNIAPPLKLDYSHARVLSSLASIPRYLSYNANSGLVYGAKNQDKKFSPASFIKLLTTQVALDLLPPEQYLTTSLYSVDQVPTILGLRIGEQLTLADLVRASIATSANDSASTIADGTARLYGIELSDFIDLMNDKSSMIGMTDSHFANPTGLDEHNQYSTLTDISKLVHNAQQNYPLILESALSDNQDIEQNEYHGHYYLPNWNGLLGVYPNVTGLKIAYTEQAGYSTIVTAKRGDIEVVVILSGANSYIERDMGAVALLNQAFSQENLSPVKITASQIKKHYQKWADLAVKIRQESK